MAKIEEVSEPSNTVSFYSAETYYESLEDFTAKIKSQGQSQIIVILPLGIVGSGKTYFYNKL